MRLLLSLLLCLPLPANAALADAVARVMPSVVALEVDGKAICAGVVVDAARRLVITAKHCIFGPGEITLTFSDGRSVTARPLGAARIDIALLRIVEAVPLTAVAAGDARALRAGDSLFSIGHPLGYRFTVTAGIVSFVDRDDGDPSGAHIQTDALANPGNSGGPLFDFNGRLVGINVSCLLAPTRLCTGINFAIPMHSVWTALAQIEGRP